MNETLGRVAVLGALLVWATGCGGGTSTEGDTDLSDTPTDGSVDSGTDVPIDTESDPPVDPIPEPDDPGCIPGCHWDCFGGTSCMDGEVWYLGFGPRPCCTYSDPWPGEGPVCSVGIIHTCDDPTCIHPVTDVRYAYCLGGVEGIGSAWASASEDSRPNHLAMLYCAEGQLKSAGDACTEDAGCRPADTGEGRLRCDTDVGQCVADDPVSPPAGFGGDCGLVPGDFAGTFIGVRNGAPSCERCHVSYRSGDGCVMQACTLECEWDEDCPDGYVCVCETNSMTGSEIRMICAQVDDRSSGAGRRVWLACP